MTTAQTNQYRQLSAEYRRKAHEHLQAGDLTQASEKGWGAAATAIKAIAEAREMEHAGHRDLWRVVRTLVRENEDRDIRIGFATAESLHINFYEAWLERDDVEHYLNEVEGLLAKLESLTPDY